MLDTTGRRTAGGTLLKMAEQQLLRSRAEDGIL